MDNNIIISICIPTRNRPLILKKTLNSIYCDKVDSKKFEVIIYDSSDNNDTQNLIYETFKYDNIIYIHGLNKNYLNLIEALKLGNGFFLKLHNDYTEFVSDSLNDIIRFIDNSLLEKPLLFFSNGNIESNDFEIFTDFNKFLIKINYLCTWSTMFGIWKDDLDIIEKQDLNHMFPHTDLLLNLYSKKRFYINNKKYFINNIISSKGGYDLFQTFSVIFLELIHQKYLENKIAFKTYQIIKNHLFYKFLIKWYCDLVILPNKYTFLKINIKKSLLTNYTYYNFFLLLILAYLRAFYLIFKKITSIFFSAKK